jgi:hypothetical protein
MVAGKMSSFVKMSEETRNAVAPANDNYPAEFLEDEFWSDCLP